MTKSSRFYVRLEVDYFDHRKTLEVGERLAYRHLKALAWCHKNRTDGYLPRAAALSIVFSEKAAGLLVAAGLWEVCDGGWCAHDYLLHQESKASLDAAANAGRIGASNRWGNAKRNG